jgi:hypothetical protein
MFVRLGLFALALSSASAAMSMQSMAQANYPRARDIEPISIWQPGAVTPVDHAAYVFGHCITDGMRNLPATISADAGAATLMNACQTQLQAVRQAALRVIEDSHWPEARKQAARAELQARFALVEQRVAAKIGQMRSRMASAAR